MALEQELKRRQEFLDKLSALSSEYGIAIIEGYPGWPTQLVANAGEIKYDVTDLKTLQGFRIVGGIWA